MNGDVVALAEVNGSLSRVPAIPWIPTCCATLGAIGQWSEPGCLVHRDRILAESHQYSGTLEHFYPSPKVVPPRVHDYSGIKPSDHLGGCRAGGEIGFTLPAQERTNGRRVVTNTER